MASARAMQRRAAAPRRGSGRTCQDVVHTRPRGRLPQLSSTRASRSPLFGCESLGAKVMCCRSILERVRFLEDHPDSRRTRPGPSGLRCSALREDLPSTRVPSIRSFIRLRRRNVDFRSRTDRIRAVTRFFSNRGHVVSARKAPVEEMHVLVLMIILFIHAYHPFFLLTMPRRTMATRSIPSTRAIKTPAPFRTAGASSLRYGSRRGQDVNVIGKAITSSKIDFGRARGKKRPPREHDGRRLAAARPTPGCPVRMRAGPRAEQSGRWCAIWRPRASEPRGIWGTALRPPRRPR